MKSGLEVGFSIGSCLSFNIACGYFLQAFYFIVNKGINGISILLRK